MAFAIYVAADGAPTSVTASTVDQVVLTHNQARKGGVVYNNGGTNMFILLCRGTAVSTAVFTAILTPNTYYQVPSNYIGEIRALWNTTASGNAQVTELI